MGAERNKCEGAPGVEEAGWGRWECRIWTDRDNSALSLWIVMWIVCHSEHLVDKDSRVRCSNLLCTHRTRIHENTLYHDWMLSGKVFIKTCTLSKRTPLPQQITINDSFQQYLFVLLLSLLHIMRRLQERPTTKINFWVIWRKNQWDIIYYRMEPGSVRQQSWIGSYVLNLLYIQLYLSIQALLFLLTVFTYL